MEKIILIGAGGHTKVLIDVINSKKEFSIEGLIDKEANVELGGKYSIIGTDEDLYNIYKDGIKFAFVGVGGLGNLQIRNKIYRNLKNIGYKVPVLIHENSIVSEYATIDEGTCIMPGCVINSGVRIGKNSIVNSGAIVEHDCIIGENVHLSPGSVLGGNVNINNNTHIGLGAKIIQGIKIGKNVTIGAGTVVIDDIEDNAVVVGVPGKIIKFK